MKEQIVKRDCQGGLLEIALQAWQSKQQEMQLPAGTCTRPLTLAKDAAWERYSVMKSNSLLNGGRFRSCPGRPLRNHPAGFFGKLLGYSVEDREDSRTPKPGSAFGRA